MTTLLKTKKAKACASCGSQMKLLFSMGKVIDQNPQRELIYTMKHVWLCKVCFERRHLDNSSSHMVWDEPEAST